MRNRARKADMVNIETIKIISLHWLSINNQSQISLFSDLAENNVKEAKKTSCYTSNIT